ncbi:hypothetical protein [Maridesulfovibrio sp.]|uniref:hypothetical protein n=1 Tax=Maridesulfovibrio sp. TaxID=2795000 RepID=UPI0029CA06D6|nr:hypothetical protein [Maridesulfovibrio sp.]
MKFKLINCGFHAGSQKKTGFEKFNRRNSMRNILMFMLSGLIIVLAGCSGDLEKVKGGTLNGRPTVTIGQAFDSAFDMPSWSESKGERGERMVTFNGFISARLHERAVDMTFIYTIMAEAEGMSQGNPFIAVGFETKVEEFFGGRSKYKKLLRKFKKSGANDKIAKYSAMYLAYSLAEWPVGEPVSASWVIHTDGKKFDFARIQSDALAGKNIDMLIDIIYGPSFVPKTKLHQMYWDQVETLLAEVKSAVALQNSLKKNKEVATTSQNIKLLSIPTDKVDELAASYLTPPEKKNIIDNWVLIGRLPNQYGSSVTRLITDDAHEKKSRFSRDFLFLDFDEHDKSTPAINLAVGVVASLDEAIQAYAGVKMFDILVDGQKQGRIKMIGRPTPSEGYIYLEHSECPAISLVYKAMMSGRRVEFVNSQDKFMFDLKGLSAATGVIQKS